MLSHDHASQKFELDLTAVSGILGSVSIACWVVVFSPQIIENLRRSSAEGLSIVFIVIWLAGDVFNILGAVLQGVLPTMTVLAVYYTLADIVLLLQCFYYRGFTLSDAPTKPSNDEQAPLLSDQTTPTVTRNESPTTSRRSSSTIRQHWDAAMQDATHLSPAVPVHSNQNTEALKARSPAQKHSSALKSVLFNSAAVVVVCFAGVLGWWLSSSATGSAKHHRHEQYETEDETLDFSLWGQVFGYICAVLYLGSRVPQLLLNYRRKSTEGISMLFFLFACIGNLTYVISIFAYEPPCVQNRHGCYKGEAGAQYGRNVAINLSWIIGSAGTLLLDAAVFVQYFMYRGLDANSNADEAIE